MSSVRDERGSETRRAVRVPPANGPYTLLVEEELHLWINRLVDAARYTIPANETGLPAISIPRGS